MKWTVVDDMQIFMSTVVNDGCNYSSMIKWLRNTYSSVPREYGNKLQFATLTGLRPGEACQSVNLIQTDLDNYLKKDRTILEHYRYPDIFIRHTKKAYLSVVNDDIVELAKRCKKCGCNALRLYITRRGMKMKMNYCSKIFATNLRRHGIAAEIIDLLNGRIPNSVFARHYFRPDFDREMKSIRECILGLHKEIRT